MGGIIVMNHLEARERVEKRRIEMRQEMHCCFLPFYDELCRALDLFDQGRFFAPYSGLRDMDQQSALYKIGRDGKGGRIVTHARAGDSPHNFGCAVDFAEFKDGYVGQDAWNKADWAHFGECVRIAKATWGGNFKRFKDRPHVELPLKDGVTWKKIGDVYRAQGFLKADELIRRSVRTSS